MFAASLKAHASVGQQRVPLMTASDVLLVAGTHGNEVNAPWLLDEWQRTPELIDAHGLTVSTDYIPITLSPVVHQVLLEHIRPHQHLHPWAHLP